MSPSAQLADKVSGALGSRFSRRGFFARSAVVGSAIAANPLTYALTPTDAYAAVCSCSGSNCDCGSTVLRRLHRVLLHGDRPEPVPSRLGARRLVEGRRLRLLQRPPLLHGLQLAGRRQLRLRPRRLQQPQDRLHQLPVRPVQPADLLHRPDPVPRRHLHRAVGDRRHLHHHGPLRRQHRLPRPALPPRPARQPRPGREVVRRRRASPGWAIDWDTNQPGQRAGHRRRRWTPASPSPTSPGPTSPRPSGDGPEPRVRPRRAHGGWRPHRVRVRPSTPAPPGPASQRAARLPHRDQHQPLRQRRRHRRRAGRRLGGRLGHRPGHQRPHPRARVRRRPRARRSWPTCPVPTSTRSTSKGPNHGFAATIPAAGGVQQVSVYAINVRPGQQRPARPAHRRDREPDRQPGARRIGWRRGEGEGLGARPRHRRPHPGARLRRGPGLGHHRRPAPTRSGVDPRPVRPQPRLRGHRPRRTRAPGRGRLRHQQQRPEHADRPAERRRAERLAVRLRRRHAGGPRLGPGRRLGPRSRQPRTPPMCTSTSTPPAPRSEPTAPAPTSPRRTPGTARCTGSTR